MHGNKLMDKLMDAHAVDNTPILNESSSPRRLTVNQDERGDYLNLSLPATPPVL